jgi:hypothetical protein
VISATREKKYWNSGPCMHVCGGGTSEKKGSGLVLCGHLRFACHCFSPMSPYHLFLHSLCLCLSGLGNGCAEGSLCNPGQSCCWIHASLELLLPSWIPQSLTASAEPTSAFRGMFRQACSGSPLNVVLTVEPCVTSVPQFTQMNPSAASVSVVSPISQSRPFLMLTIV